MQHTEIASPQHGGDMKLVRSSGFRRVCGDLFFLIRHEKKWWLLPMIIIVLIIAALIAFTASAGPLAPFIYSLM
jgi:hypothetical protein